MRLLVLLCLLPLPALALTEREALELFQRARGGDAAALADLTRAAQGGDPPAQFQLGRAYSHGSPALPRDDAQAASWVKKAAAQGHPEAQSNLGYLYSVGMGVPQSGEKALAWWTRAAEAGYVQAQFNLAVAYLQGKLVAADEEKALAWTRKAAAQGNARALSLYRDLCRRTPARCKDNPPPAHFVFDLDEPRLRISIPDAPPMTMAPHPLAGAQPHARFMGGANGYSISILTPTADAGMTPVQCANAIAADLVRRYGLKREAIVTRRTSEVSFVMLFPVNAAGTAQLKAYLLSGHGGTHCVEVHVSKVVASEKDVAAWFEGFAEARIEAPR